MSVVDGELKLPNENPTIILLLFSNYVSEELQDKLPLIEDSELSWTHYRLLMRVENENAREFYIQEAVKSQWSTRQLERQINSFFYERLLSSKNKEQVAEEIQTLELAKKPEDVIRDPYVLEFLGLTPNDDFYESDLEQALITHLQNFLLELGRGFSFVARQKRITFDGRHFKTRSRIDLVFYNYILKCFVLIDLITHQDLGQMQMYVHYYERELMNEGDNPPIGIVLCADKSESVLNIHYLKMKHRFLLQNTNCIYQARKNYCGN